MRESSRPAVRPRARHPRVLGSLSLIAILAAACGPNAVTPTVHPSTSAAPFASASAANPSPTPSASANPAAAAVDAFVALVNKPGFSYQATFSGSLRHPTGIEPVTRGLLQVSGKDVLVRATFAFPDHRYVAEHRYVGGKGWLRHDTTDAWHRLAIVPATTMAAFAAVHTKADVTYVGPVTSGGKTFYRVSFRSAIVNPVMIPAGNLTEAVLTSPTLTILIDTSGRPVKGTAEVNGKGRVSGQLQEIIIDLTVTFTKVGSAVTIKAP